MAFKVDVLSSSCLTYGVEINIEMKLWGFKEMSSQVNCFSQERFDHELFMASRVGGDPLSCGLFNVLSKLWC